MKTHITLGLSRFAACFSAQCSVISAQLKGAPIMAANEAPEPEIFAVNEAAYGVTEEGVMVVPFGEVPVMVSINGRKLRGLQRIDATAGNEMAADMGGIIGLIKSAFLGRPIFLGHPYHPDAAEAAKYPDKRARGFVKSVEVANDSIRLIPKYNKLGNEEVTDQQMIFHSPQWRMRPVMAANGQQEVKAGMPVFRPYSLHSGGLTNNPNIPVPPLMGANEDVPKVEDPAKVETPAKSDADPLDLSELLNLLKAQGVIKPEDDKTAILAALSGLFRELEWARERKTREAAEMAVMKKAVPDAANEATFAEMLQSLCSRMETTAANESGLETDLTTANEKCSVLSAQFDAARAAHVDAALKPLITAAKIPGNQIATMRTELISAANEEDITARIAELSKSKPKLGTGGGPTDDLAGKGKVVMAANAASNRSQQRAQLVSDCLAEITHGGAARAGDQERAWNTARTRNPELFKH